MTYFRELFQSAISLRNIGMDSYNIRLFVAIIKTKIRSNFMVSSVNLSSPSVHSLHLSANVNVDAATVTCEVAHDAAPAVVESKVEQLTLSQIAAKMAQEAVSIQPTDIKV